MNGFVIYNVNNRFRVHCHQVVSSRQLLQLPISSVLRVQFGSGGRCSRRSRWQCHKMVPRGLNVSVKETARRWNRGGDVRCTWYGADCVSGDRIQDRVAAKLIFCQSDAHVSRPLLAVLVHITRLHNFVMQHSGSSRSLYVVSYCASSRAIGMMIMTKYKQKKIQVHNN